MFVYRRSRTATAHCRHTKAIVGAAAVVVGAAAAACRPVGEISARGNCTFGGRKCAEAVLLECVEERIVSATEVE